MDMQLAFDLAVGIAGFLGGWVLFNINDSLKSLKDADTSLMTKVQAIEVLVAGRYVTREELNHDLEKIGRDIFAMLHRIDDKLDNKVDK